MGDRQGRGKLGPYRKGILSCPTPFLGSSINDTAIFNIVDEGWPSSAAPTRIGGAAAPARPMKLLQM